MKDLTIKKNILKCFEEINIFISKFDEKDELKNYIFESFQFISLIMEIEEHFKIIIPDEALYFENFATFEQLFKLIKELLKLKTIKI